MTSGYCEATRGKGMGGTTIINGLRYVRGNKKDFDHWAPEWAYEYVLPYFIKSENTSVENADVGYHGYGGPVHSEYVNPFSIFGYKIVDGNKDLGYKELDYNGKEQMGISLAQQNTLKGSRHSAAKGYIDPILDRPNVEFLENSYVTKILIDDKSKTATGVLFTYNKHIFKISARKEVILSAGSVSSPHLLMLSGIGPANHLIKHGIRVVKNLAVGQNLIDHPTYSGLYINTNLTLQNKTIWENLIDYFHGFGQYTVAVGTEVVGFYQSDVNTEEHGYSDIEIYYKPPYPVIPSTLKGAGLIPEVFEAIFGSIDSLSVIQPQILNLHPNSRGSIRLQSNNPFEYPIVDFNFYSDSGNKDIKVIHYGINIILKLLETPTFKQINASLAKIDLPQCKDFEYLSEEYWDCSIKLLTGLGHHLMGTCKMGPDPLSGDVVDSNLKVHGIKHLRVVDSSVLNRVSGHTTAPTFVVAEKISDIIKLEHGIKVEQLDQDYLNWALLNKYLKTFL